jgi:hypothetical protein
MAFDSLVAGPVSFQLQADQAIRDYCGWHIAPTTTETVTVDGTGLAMLFLPSLHVESVSEVVDAGVPLVADLDYWLRPGGVLVRSNLIGWTGRVGGVQLVITHGFAEVPADLVGVAADLAGRLELGAAGGVVTSGGFALSGLNQGLDAIFTAGSYEATVLDHYRIPNIR